ncbi:MAG: ABC transporter permease [Chloroflexi bacterium]|nr:MAG: ABC transporter permease [Chloroflexota bacterium]
MSFGRYLIRRVIGIIGVLLGVSLLTFTLSHLVPADPVLAALGQNAREEQIEAFRREYGLDRPLPEQYVRYMWGLLHGDLGHSIRTRRPVLQDLIEFFPATIELSLAALLISLLIGIPAGIFSALHRNRLIDHAVRLFSLAGSSLPIFWLGLILIGLLYNRLQLFPSPGRIDPFVGPPRQITGLYLVDSLLTGNWPALRSALAHMILPAFTLGYYSTAVLARMTRSSMLEVLGQDYIRTAHAKGLRGRSVILRHALKNAMLPTLTVIGLVFGSLLSGAVLTETIFAWPGLGRYATASAINLDFPAVMGVTLLAATVYPLVNLIVDLGYHALDPRIRYG